MKAERKIVDVNTYVPILREILSQGKEVSITITGNSMSPFLVHERDEIVITPSDGKWKKGDMAFFMRTNGRYIMHRICKVEKSGECYFVGDAQQEIEGPIQPCQIFGKITKVKRKGKWIGPEDFWWIFFERVWINVIPFRAFFRYIYGAIWRLKKLCGII